MVELSPALANLLQQILASNQGAMGGGTTTTPATTPPATTTPDPNATAPTTSGSNKSDPTQTLANISAAQLAAQVANWAAQLEFTKERFRLLELPQFQFQSTLAVDQLAFQKATTAWQQAFQEASMTGTYQGKPTTQWLTEQAQLTGVLDGNQTLQGKLTDAQVAQMNASMKLAQDNHDLDVQKFGFQQTQWNAEFGLSQAAQQLQYMGYDPKTGQTTLQKQAQDASITGYDQYGRPTLARQGQEASEAQQYLSLLSGLRGPQNAFAQARVIGNTPNSIRDIAAAWAGKYQIGATTGSGMNPTPASVGGLLGPGGMPFTGSGAENVMPTGPQIAPEALSAIPHAPPPIGPGSFAMAPYVPPAAAAAPAPAAPTGAAAFYAIPAGNDPVPGRGLDPSQWNAATQAAVAAWNAAHPGFTANGTQLGYGYTGPIPAGNTPLDFSQTIPGRGIPPGQWNAATQAAVTAWNAAHPGYVANGSPAGYAIATATTPNVPGATTPPVGIPPGGVVTPTPGVTPGTSNEGGVPGTNEGGVGGPPQTSVGGGGTPGTGGHPDTAGYSPAAAAAAAAGTPAYQAAAASPQSYAPAPYQTAAAPYAGYGAGNGSAWNPQASGVGESAAGTPVYSPPGVAAPPGMWNYTPTSSGQVQVHPPGAYADPMSPQFSTTSPASPDDQSSWMKSILPNQINAESYQNMNTYNQALGWAGMEDNGWDIGAAQDAFKKSLPRYGGPMTGSFGR